MKHLRPALIAFVCTLGPVFAQDQERRAPPVEIPDFSNLEEYFYEPKSTVTFGFRFISGAKLNFGGQGRIPAPEDPGAATGSDFKRTYHDGSVSPDARVVARLDSSGNPVIDPQANSVIFDPIIPDGRTNTWAYADAGQLSRLGYVAFRSYSAEVVDTGVRETDGNSGYGMDIAVTRDIGKLFRGRIPWGITMGVSINDISGISRDTVLARISTLTDFYSTYGRTPPGAPYSSPSSATTEVIDAKGNPVLNEDGTTRTVTVDTSVLISNQPDGRTITDTVNNTNVTTSWRIKGAYMTFRVGPSFWVPITTRLRAGFSVGAAAVYSGTTYSVNQTLVPDFGPDITDTKLNETDQVLVGYYADATLQYDLTERAGLYAGAVMQSTGSYTQEIDSENASYSTKIDLANQNGFRAGLSIRF
jgi:hypothetical protein